MKAIIMFLLLLFLLIRFLFKAFIWTTVKVATCVVDEIERQNARKAKKEMKEEKLPFILHHIDRD